MQLDTTSTRCLACGRRHYRPRLARADAGLPLIEWGDRQYQPPATPPPARPALRLHLTMAAEARRRGDYGAAAIHDTDALLAARAERAAALRIMEGRAHG